MTFAEFCVEALDHIQNGSYAMKPTVRMFTKGYQSTDPLELEFIRSSNIRYFDSDSDVLLGNFL